MRRGLLLVVVAVLVVVVPAGLLVWMRLGSEDRLSGLEPDPVPILVSVESREVTDQTAVTVGSEWGDPVAVVAPPWSGTVTQVRVAPGDEIDSGDVVVRIDGVDRVAVATRDPFFRPLRLRDVGDDVGMLQQWLTDVGLFLGDVDGVFGSDLVNAVKALAESLGVVRPDGSFDPGWVVWLPGEPFEVASVGLSRGAPVPGGGVDVLVGPVPLVSVAITDQDGRPFGAEGVWVLEVGDVEVLVVDGGIDADGLSVLAGVLDPQEPAAAGRIRRQVPVETLEVPATAVVSNAEGNLCVFTPDGGMFSATAVVLGGGRVSRVEVDSGLSSGDVVLANPTDVFENPTCP